MPLSNLILLCGRARSGKDTIANYLAEKYNYKILHFADPLKRGCQEIFGFSNEQLYGDQKMLVDQYWGMTPREALQIVGTDLIRERVDNDFWLRRLAKEIRPGERICIADGRFPNEVEFIKDLGGYCIRIVRPAVERLLHRSENYIENLEVDYEIVNDGSVVELFQQVESVISS